MHVIHAVENVFIEFDREYGHKLTPLTQQKFWLESVHRVEKLSKDSYDILFALERGGDNWATEYDISRHMVLRRFDIAIFHGLEVSVEMLSGEHRNSSK